MRFRNDGKGEANILQNQFTRYLMTAIDRKKTELQRKTKRLRYHEQLSADYDYLVVPAADGAMLDDLQFTEEFENTELERALQRLGKRERYILLMRVLEKREFFELAEEIGLKYKGVAAIYYRAIRKIQKEMREEKT